MLRSIGLVLAAGLAAGLTGSAIAATGGAGKSPPKKAAPPAAAAASIVPPGKIEIEGDVAHVVLVTAGMAAPQLSISRSRAGNGGHHAGDRLA